MKVLTAALILLTLTGCISSSRPAAPATTVIVPANSHTTVVCSDGTQPPCN